MTASRELYTELLSLTKLFMTLEYQASEKIFSERETYYFFKNFAEKRHEEKKQLVQKPSSVTIPTAVPSSPVVPAFQQKLTVSAKEPSPQNFKSHLPLKETLPNPLEKTPPSIEKALQSPKTNEEKQFFVREQPSVWNPPDFSELRKLVIQKLPHLQLLDNVFDDAEAKFLASSWKEEKKKPQIAILAFDDIPKNLDFLGNVAKALEGKGAITQVFEAAKIEYNQGWNEFLQAEELKLVIASSSGFHHLKGLLKFYKEGTKQATHFLGKQPLLLLADLSFYFKEPALKHSLWATLKKLLIDLSLA